MSKGLRFIKPPGPWDREHDGIGWRHLGYPCSIIRCRPDESGYLCGYVGIDPSHPWWAKSYSDKVPCNRDELRINESDPMGMLIEALSEADGMAQISSILQPHGGVTYSSEGDGFWWFGFDCAHFNDLQPCYLEGYKKLDGTYRDMEFVTKEVEKMAEAIAFHGSEQSHD